MQGLALEEKQFHIGMGNARWGVRSYRNGQLQGLVSDAVL
jgi:hypothetical protein